MLDSPSANAEPANPESVEPEAADEDDTECLSTDLMILLVPPPPPLLLLDANDADDAGDAPFSVMLSSNAANRTDCWILSLSCCCCWRRLSRKLLRIFKSRSHAGSTSPVRFDAERLLSER